jgi:hypothetical protein
VTDPMTDASRPRANNAQMLRSRKLPRWWFWVLILLGALGPVPTPYGFKPYFPVGLVLILAPFHSDNVRAYLINLGWFAAVLAAYVLLLYAVFHVVTKCVSFGRRL